MYPYLIHTPIFSIVLMATSWAKEPHTHHADSSTNVNGIFSFIPPPPDPIVELFIPPPPDSSNIPKTVLSEIEKFIQNQNTIAPETITNLNQNIIPPEPINNLHKNIQTPSVQADYTFGTSDYYFTLFHNQPQFTYSEAYNFCHNLLGNWHVVSIESLQESQQISNIVAHYNLRFIWLGATKQNGFFTFWDSGEKFSGINFSKTGRYRTPQPDNSEFREKNIPEDCLAILDKFYPGDGITWHDIACYHRKVTICEKHHFNDLHQNIQIPSVQADYSVGTSDYYFTWFHNQPQLTYFEAHNFCHNLLGNWHVVSIESLQESQQISNIVAHYNLRFIWIGATKQNGVFRFWDSGERFLGINFSSTGRYKTPQPDNSEFREKNIPEDCLAIMDHFYPGDGITWHDIACYHKKVTICERHRFR